jgi:hypothetical protein
MKRGLSFWDLLAWIVLILIFLWLVLKTLGIINTPTWLEYAPLYGAIYLAGWQISKLANVAQEVKDLKRFKDATVHQINEIKTNCVKNHK